MQIQFEYAPWGIFFAAVAYIVGNGVWVNHLVRRRLWFGWLLWGIAGGLLLLVAAMFEARLGTTPESAWQRLASVDPENHWIALSLFALLSVPGAASVMFRQSMRWTRLALLLPALLIFIPVGRQLGHPGNDFLLWSLGSALAVSGILVGWQALLDCEPEDVTGTRGKKG